ncbi:ionotropic receptor 93a-like isoform X2 [Panulirus ornatus]|uniref:ionotropic receptor 93a-like isoform X2 n=1 Tax=Panulirus ornatus TaxID=150431 RepID=UPI003A879ED5
MQRRSVTRTWFLMAVFVSQEIFTRPLHHQGSRLRTADGGEDVDGTGAGPVVVRLLTEMHHSSCSVVVITDSHTSPATILKELVEEGAPGGLVVLQASGGGWTSNTTEDDLPHLIHQARQVRLLWSCVSVVVVSDDLAFLASFGEWSLRGRLLVWETRALAVTRLTLQEVHALVTTHWTFAMMNTMILLPETPHTDLRWNVYSHLPYGRGGGQLVKLASWSATGTFNIQASFVLFPDKFSNFNRAVVNVTALPYKPYWMTVGNGGPTSGEATVTYSGSDRLLLEAIASALNFTIHVLPVKSWEEVVTLVEERVSFVASVVHMMLPQRSERYGFTRSYEHGVNLAFGMSKPSLKPRWQSLYYPLANDVWLSILLVLILLPPVLYLVTGGSPKGAVVGVGSAVEVVVGTLLGQGFPRHVPRTTSTRVLLGTWLVFALVFGTAYRGNLIASLALPKYPPRPENLGQLVKVVYRITMPSYGAEFRDFLRQSESPSFRAMGRLMHVGVSVLDGLQQATRDKQAHVDGLRYLEQMIAEHFTRADGSTQLYVGREGVLPGLNAWPIPHDAPYKHAFDRVINVVQEVIKDWPVQQVDGRHAGEGTAGGSQEAAAAAAGGFAGRSWR